MGFVLACQSAGAHAPSARMPPSRGTSTDARALSREHARLTVEDSHPELTEGHVLFRPPYVAYPVRARYPFERTYAFDYVTVPLDAKQTSSTACFPPTR